MSLKGFFNNYCLCVSLLIIYINNLKIHQNFRWRIISKNFEENCKIWKSRLFFNCTRFTKHKTKFAKKDKIVCWSNNERKGTLNEYVFSYIILINYYLVYLSNTINFYLLSITLEFLQTEFINLLLFYADF